PRTVTAVCAANDLTYLPRTIAALTEQDRPADEIVLVDVPTDGLELAGALGAADVRIVRAPGARTCGDAAGAAVGAGVDGDWLWLLHDDSPPEPGALAELLRATELAGTVAVAGCKQVRADDPARLVSVGVRTTASGRRLSPIEAGEVDQGQY